MTVEEEELPQLLKYHQRTGHKIKMQDNILQFELDKFQKYSKNSKFVINEKKTEVIIFNLSKKYTFPPNLQFGQSEILCEVPVTTLLGLKIQNSLKWQENTDFICKKAAQKHSYRSSFQKFGLHNINFSGRFWAFKIRNSDHFRARKSENQPFLGQIIRKLFFFAGLNFLQTII